MANKVKITDGQGTQVFPITHVTAVIDNNGNSVEQVLGMQTDLIQQAQLEIGAVPSDLTPTSGSSHWVTSDGVYNATVGNSVEWRVLDTSSVPAMKYWLSVDLWNASVNLNKPRRRCKMITLPANVRVRLVNGQYSTNYSVLADGMVVSDSIPNFATGWERKSLAYGEEVEFQFPNDGYALYLLTQNDDYQDTTPTVYVAVDKDDNFSFATHHYVDKAVGFNPSGGVIDLAEIPETSAALGNTEWLDYETRKSKFIPIQGGCYYRITAKENNTTFAFLKNANFAREAAIDFASGAVRETVLATMSTLKKAPSDAEFLCVTTYISFECEPTVESISSAELERMRMKETAGASIMQNGIVVSDSEYKYAFFPHTMYISNHVKMVFAGNKTTTDGDATVNTNKMVLADYDIMTGEWTNSEMPNVSSFIDSNGDTISGITMAYNNCVFVPVGGDIGMFGIMGDGTHAGFSWGYKTTFDGTAYTRCHLVYDNNEVEFSSDNYRQMLYDKGWTNSLVSAEGVASDCTAIYYDGAKYYAVFCTYSIKAEKIKLPIVLLESVDLATWSVVARLGSQVHAASEIRFVIKGGKVYVIYRAINTDDNTDGSNGYGIGIYQYADGTALYEKEYRSCILSLPMCFEVNGNVWFGFNNKPDIFGTPNNLGYPYGRQQMSFYKANANNDGIVYQFDIENVSGFNYPTTVTVPTLTKKQGDSGRTLVSNLDRLYIAWSEDRRNLNYRQINNVTLANITSLFV